jgi:hypothetical protein
VALKCGSWFGVTTDGTLYATNANISGNLYATGGTIGDWHISTTQITNGISAGDNITNRVGLSGRTGSVIYKGATKYTDSISFWAGLKHKSINDPNNKDIDRAKHFAFYVTETG